MFFLNCSFMFHIHILSTKFLFVCIMQCKLHDFTPVKTLGNTYKSQSFLFCVAATHSQPRHWKGVAVRYRPGFCISLQERLATQCTGGRVGLRANVHGHGKSRFPFPTGIWPPTPSSLQQVTVLTALSQLLPCYTRIIINSVVCLMIDAWPHPM